MNWFEKVKRYYDKGLYTIDQVRVFVQGNKITEEQFKEITGEDYNIPSATKTTRTTRKKK